ncbi:MULTISPECIES: lytic transglycosylase domain-containing protein [Vibrio]|uniref:lytic transglycosylase domain-containing protein n=1 Tax=Vibrio TaxID=662 RepID=UPI0005B53A35|nr:MULTISPECIES: lytic transglycosylase domain-containing protein [Vibrio]EGR1056744.1 lytic transglycosylase domain-containing protein [Vibrio cholerae]EGR1117022.1 lytic transglycosylase domain-containing protein [Vibrio cholerae]EKF9078749.1 lytic transglycosylase domain-containing protein [Vibrio cholerae]MVB87018.1 lytic transglycosylase domain-containing protein [Vibrio cholerae]MVF39505.1 lytic transglycosylase domain-containing protein [Vibrio cholerae]
MKHILLLLLMCSCSVTAQVKKGERNYLAWSSTYNRPAPKAAHCVKYCDAIKTYSQIYGVPENLVISVIKNESGFDASAVSPKGAKGLMQIMDSNSKHYGIDPFNPNENINTGVQMLSKLITKYESIPLALAAYNAGEGNVSKYGGIPPFKETQNYVNNVIRHYEVLNNAKR